MTGERRYSQGTFCWVDLATIDTVAAKVFYGQVMGWSAADMPTDQGIPYTMLSHAGKQVAGLYPINPVEPARPHWSAYIGVDDLDAMSERAVSLGGKVVMPAMDASGAGRMCFVADPTGAVFGLWQPLTHRGAENDNAIGARSWCELQTSDVAAASQYYGALFGWSARTSESIAEGDYVIFELEGVQVGGMLPVARHWSRDLSNWSVYFGIEDCDGAVSRSVELGAEVIVEPMSIVHVGRFAHLIDPQGAHFALVQFDHPA